MSRWKKSGRNNRTHQSEPKNREQLEALFGRVWDTAELAREYVVTAIIDDQIIVRRKADGLIGRLTLQNQPRYYFGFLPSADGSEGDRV